MKMNFFENFKEEDKYNAQFFNDKNGRYNFAYQKLPAMISVAVLKNMSQEELSIYKQMIINNLQDLVNRSKSDPEYYSDYKESYDYYSNLDIEQFRSSFINEKDLAADLKEKGIKIPRYRFGMMSFYSDSLCPTPYAGYTSNSDTYFFNYSQDFSSFKPEIALFERVENVAKFRCNYIESRLKEGLTMPEIYDEFSKFSSMEDFSNKYYGEFGEFSGKAR